MVDSHPHRNSDGSPTTVSPHVPVLMARILLHGQRLLALVHPILLYPCGKCFGRNTNYLLKLKFKQFDCLSEGV